MKDKLLTYAIGISLVVHLVGVCVVARTSALRLNAAPERPQQQRLVNVDLVQTPDEATKPKPIAPRVYNTPRPEPRLNEPQPEPYNVSSYMPEQPRASHSSIRSISQTPHGSSSRPSDTPGGRIRVGSLSDHGDIGGLDGGTSGSGYVPNRDGGKGTGSGTGEGIGTPDPPRHIEIPVEHPAPRQDPPPPRMVSVRVCNESGLLPGRYCDRTHSEDFVEGREPSRTCERCRAPEPPKRNPEPEHVSRLADRSLPEIIGHDPLKGVQPPASVPEDESVTVIVGYTCTKDGEVEGVHVTRSSGYRAMDKLVVDAVSRRKYKPAVQNGEPRSVPMNATYRSQ